MENCILHDGSPKKKKKMQKKKGKKKEKKKKFTLTIDQHYKFQNSRI